jgi:hypothetical protein
LRFPDYKPLQRFVIGMPTSFSCQRPFPDFLLSGSPLPAERSADLEPSLRVPIKKPGVERRASPSIRLGRSLPAQPPERICSKLVCLVPGVRNQPHLNLWPVPVRQRTPQRSEALPTSKQYTHFRFIVKLHSINLYPLVILPSCAFLSLCGKFSPAIHRAARPLTSVPIAKPFSGSLAARFHSFLNTPPSAHSDSANERVHQSTCPPACPSHARRAIQSAPWRFSR